MIVKANSAMILDGSKDDIEVVGDNDISEIQSLHRHESSRNEIFLMPRHDNDSEVDMSKSARNNNPNVQFPLVIGKGDQLSSPRRTKKSKNIKKKHKNQPSPAPKFAKTFDHYKILTSSPIFQISEISIFSSKLILGLEVKYSVDSKPVISL